MFKFFYFKKKILHILWGSDNNIYIKETFNEQEYEQLNNKHSTAGDNLDDDLEKELGEQLEEKQGSLERNLEKIQELIDWFCNQSFISLFIN